MRQDSSSDRITPNYDSSPSPQRREAAADASACSDPVHDLYSLLAVIIGVCESLAGDAGQRPENRELARVGVLAAERAAKLVGGLNATSSMEPAGTATVTDLAARRVLRQAARVEPPGVEDQAKRVLIVEDDPDLLLLLTAAFAREGFKTYAANNGRKGLELLASLQPDLMITDIIMPEMEGIGTMLDAKRSAPGIKVIAISGGGHYGRSQNLLEWASELGADEVLAKPFRVSSLIMAARVVLDRPASMPDRLDPSDGQAGEEADPSTLNHAIGR